MGHLAEEESEASMIRVAVDVRSKATRFSAAVWADSVEQAVRLARRRYPSCEVRVLFPIDPESFFAEEKSPEVETVLELPNSPRQTLNERPAVDNTNARPNRAARVERDGEAACRVQGKAENWRV